MHIRFYALWADRRPRGRRRLLAGAARDALGFSLALGCGLALGAPGAAQAQVSPVAAVTGAVQKPLLLDFDALSALPQTTVNVSFLSGSGSFSGSFTGVPMWTLLNDVAGLKSNPEVHNDVLRQVAMASATDGYKATWSLGEIDPGFGGSAAEPQLLANLMNGAPLGSSGMARTVTPGDIRGGRYVSNVTTLEVIHAPAWTQSFSGGASTSLNVTGLVSTQPSFTAATLAALPSSTATVGADTWKGVPLWTLLSNAGLVATPGVHNALLRQYVVATASDGYQAVISLGEINPQFGDETVLVAYELNGQALTSSGFARLILPGDSKRGRWVSNIVNLEIYDASQWVAYANRRLDLGGVAFTTESLQLKGGQLISTGGAGTLDAPVYAFEGGVIGPGVTLGPSGAATQASGLTLLYGKIAAAALDVAGGGINVFSGASVLGATTVAAGATLSGAGKLGTTTVAGVLAPGDLGAVGTMSFSGPLTFLPGSTFLVAASGGQTSKVVVAGSAALNGALRFSAASAAEYPIGQTVALVSASGGTTGGFSSVEAATKAVLPTLSYQGGVAAVTFAPNTISSQLPGPVSGNALRAAGAVDAILLTAQAPGQFLGLFDLPSGALPSALGQFAGEPATAMQTSAFSAFGQFISALTDPSLRAGGGHGAPALAFAEPQTQGPLRAGRSLAAAQGSGWTVWAAGTGATGAISGDAAQGAHGVSFTSAGGVVGADYRPAPDLLIGFGAMGGGTYFGLNGGAGNGYGQVGQFGLYGSKRFGAGYVTGAFGYGFSPTTTNRTVSVGGAAESLAASATGNVVGGRIELGARLLDFGGQGVSPYAAFEGKSYWNGGYSEWSTAGAASYGLTYSSASAASLRSELGLRFDAPFALAGGVDLVAFGRVAWAHEFDRSRDAAAVFSAFSLTPFLVEGARPAADAALVSIGAEASLGQGWRVAAKADAEAATTQFGVRGLLSVAYSW